MLTSYLLIIPIIGIFIIFSLPVNNKITIKYATGIKFNESITTEDNYYNKSNENIKLIKIIALITSIINLIISLFIFLVFDFSNNQFQFVQENYQISSFDFYLGIDGLSIYFVLLTTFIMPIALLAN
jgi:NADH-ubiquinone oxidoreductase chain 4